MREIPGSLSHAYIVTGGGASSREEYARHLAQAFVCSGTTPPCGQCRDCRKAQEGIHPDVIILTVAQGEKEKQSRGKKTKGAEKEEKDEKRKREISVDQTRALRADAYIRPNEAARKVYIIDPAQAMNTAAQNVLLKILEDGPPYAAFVLVSDQAGALLETLRSRCEIISLLPENEEPDPAQWEKAQLLAKRLLEEDELALAAFLAAWEGEKPRSEEVLDVFQLAERAVEPSLAKMPVRVVPALEKLREMRSLRPFNVGAGHLLGLLAAEYANPVSNVTGR